MDCRLTQIIRQPILGDDRNELRPQLGLDANLPGQIADAQSQSSRLDLRREFEAVTSIGERGDGLRLASELRFARAGCQRESGESLAAKVNGSPWATTSSDGRASIVANVYRGVSFHGRVSRAHTFCAAAGISKETSATHNASDAAPIVQPRTRELGVAVRKSVFRASSETCSIAAWQRASERLCSQRLWASSMMPSSWSPTAASCGSATGRADRAGGTATPSDAETRV